MVDQAEVPLYEQVKRDLLAAIGRGEYRPDEPFITQQQVCERFGVSTTTAVRALNELVADGVLVRHRGKGTFVAESRTEAPVSGDRAVACIVHGLYGPHVSGIVQGVESVCADRGYRMFLSDSDASAEREGRALRQAIATGAAGVVLYPVDGEANTDLVEELRRRRIPLVLVDRYRTDLATDAVVTDDYVLGYEITRVLVDRGHQRIGTLWSEINCTSVRDRLTGHQQALRELGLPVMPELIRLQSYWPQPDPVRRAILGRLLDAATPATALLCANGFVAAAAAGDLLHLDAGARVELASMDDAGPYGILPLTALSATLPSRLLGERAARLLMDRIVQDDPYHETQRIVLAAEVRRQAGPVAYLQSASAR